MQNSNQQPQPTQQHTSSRLLQSLIHTYTQGENNQSQYIAQSQATIHDMNYDNVTSYQSNNSQKQQSRLIELIEKKESQLKNLQTFLIKEFQQINQHKEKRLKFKTNLQYLLNGMIGLKYQVQQYKEVCRQLQQMKHFVTSQVEELFHTVITQREAINSQRQAVKTQREAVQTQRQAQKQLLEESLRQHEQSRLSYQESIRQHKQSTQASQKQIGHMKSVIDQQYQQLHHLKHITTQQSKQITKLNQQLTHYPMTNSLQPFKLQEEHLSKPIEKNQSLRQLSEEQLQVSFSADKNNKAKQLISAIFQLKSNQSLLNSKEDGDLRASNKTVQEQHNKPQGKQQRTFTGGFNHILLKGSTSSQSQQQHQEIDNQQIKSPQQRSQCIQTSQVRRINSSVNYVGNDASSAINKLDEFSQLNHVEYSQFDDLSYYKDYDDQNYSEIEFRNMAKAKICRSMKATRNPNYNGYGNGNGNYTEDRHSNIRISDNAPHPSNDLTKKPSTQQTPPKKQPLNHKQSPAQQNQIPMQQSFHKRPPTPSRQQNSPKDQLESPNTKRKNPHRYDYCRLYEEQQIKQIENINNMCNHLILNDKPNVVMNNATRFSPFNSFEKVINLTKQLTPTKKSRQISPRIPSYSKLEPNRFQLNQQIQSSTKTFVRSVNHPVSSFSSSKKPLTIQIPASPQRTQNSNQRTLPNPYLKLQNHLHQLSCQQFSPTRSRYMNERTSSGYLDRSDNKSRTSYSDLRSEVRGDMRTDELVSSKKYSQQQPVYYNNVNHQQKSRPKQRQHMASTYQQHIISNNIDRKEYIKSKIQMIKKKNMTQNQPITKSPHKISFLKSDQPQNHLSKQQLQRPIITKQIPRTNNKSIYEQDQERIKGYDFNEDKFEKEVMDKSRRTDKSVQLQNSTLSKVDRSKDASRVSYTNANYNNVGYSKNDRIEKLPQFSKQNPQKSSSNLTISQEEHYNDIYQQLNYNMTSQSQTSQQRIPTTQQSVTKKPLNRPTQPTRQSVSPLRQTTKNTNTMYIPYQNNRSMKKPMDNQAMEVRYNEDNLNKHPYMMDRRRTSDIRGNTIDDNTTVQNTQMFRRF